MPERPTAELLFGNPERAAPKVSPDGRRWAYLAPDEGVLNIWSGPEGEQAEPLTRDRGRGIRNYLWAEDGRSLLYIQDRDGDENWRLYQCDLATRAVRDLTPLPGVQAQVVGTEPRFPDEILVALNDRDPRLHDVWRVSLKDGSRRKECDNPGDAVGWLADRDFRVGLHKAAAPDGGTILRLRAGAGWRDFLACGPDDQLGAHGFTPDGRAVYLESSLGRDTTALLEAPLSGGPARTLAEHPESDLAGALLHPRTGRAEAAAFEVERLSWAVLDPALERDFAALSRLAEGDAQLVSRDDADRIWYAAVSRPDRSPAWWRYDRSSGDASFLFSSRPRLDGLALAGMRPVSFRARDGLLLRGYLTVPPGAPAKGLPLVLLVHGGPWARDRWGFQPEAQWLASLGIACLQVNFRGSTGYGKRFLHAGDREWGAKMQDDLSDAAAWAVAEGLADPGRLAVFGASYGGYAALCAAAFTPKLFRCAVDVVGPSSLSTLIRSIPPYWEPLKRVFDLRVGRLDEESFLDSRSPLHHAEKIEIPLLIAQGANDPRVKREESERIVAALRARGRAVEYLLFEDEGHGFAKPANRLRFYAAAEAFLRRHLLGEAAAR